MRAGDLMTRDPVTVRPDDTVHDAARLMRDLNVGSLPVCDGGRLVGIVTDRDITLRATADGMRPDATPVKMVMTEELHCCAEEDSVESIEREMAGHRIRRLPVVDAAKRLVGILALGDLAADRAGGTEKTLRSISTPAEPDRQAAKVTAAHEATDAPADAPWPAYGEAAEPTRE
ncbi:CBS domain-containing protein [soil metagenome]